MTILMSGINMYSMALVMKVVLGWDLNFSIWLSSLVVGIYVALGGLRSAIFNEILQFVLIWAGALLIPVLGMLEVGGWQNLMRQIETNVGAHRLHPPLEYAGAFQRQSHGHSLDRHHFWLGLCAGVWLLDHRLPGHPARTRSRQPAFGAPRTHSRRSFQNAGSADRYRSGTAGARSITLPPVARKRRSRQPAATATNEVLPLMLVRYCGPGLIGLGVTALIAGFMSGMAGNVSAFSNRVDLRHLRGLPE